MQKRYNKLVRDRIPEIIKKNGDTCIVRKLKNKEFKIELFKKLIEEANEVVSAKGKNELVLELADLKEVVLAIQKLSKIDSKEIEKVRKQRLKERGRFEKKIFLVKAK